MSILFIPGNNILRNVKLDNRRRENISNVC